LKNSPVRKRGRVFVGENFAGVIEESEGVCSFTYDPDYLKKEKAKQVSLTLPLRKRTVPRKNDDPFFDGLIPEGWLLNIITENWKIDPRDRMSLLLLACKDCIGNISVVEEKSQ
jgi:serine/threonine-protein kinase HipA